MHVAHSRDRPDTEVTPHFIGTDKRAIWVAREAERFGFRYGHFSKAL